MSGGRPGAPLSSQPPSRRRAPAAAAPPADGPDRGTASPSTAAPADPPPAAAALFAERLPLARRYAVLLATEGIRRGLIGPREVPRLWDRHLLNCVVLAELLPVHSAIADLGSGAGLPGMVLAVARPDLQVTLIEPMARRAAFLEEAVQALLLDRVRVVRARAEDLVGEVSAPVVTARAVAPLDRLAQWALPLLTPGGRLLAVKGSSAPEEVAAHRRAVTAAGGTIVGVRECGVGVVDPPTTVVEVRKGGTPRAGGRRGERP